MNKQLGFSIIRKGRFLAILGTVFLGISGVGYFFSNDQFNNSKNQIDSLTSRYRHLDYVWDGCNTMRLSICPKYNRSQVKQEMISIQNRIPSITDKANQQKIIKEVFWYSCIASISVTIIGILMLYGRSLAFINQVLTGDISNSQVPINTAPGSTTIGAEEISELSIENYSNSVRNNIEQSAIPSYNHAEEIKFILAGIQKLVTESKELANERKMLALQQIESIAKSCEKPKDLNQRRIIDQGILTLKGVAASLPDVAKTAESLNKLLFSLSSLLGL